jgi:hypothetical protein
MVLAFIMAAINREVVVTGCRAAKAEPGVVSPEPKTSWIDAVALLKGLGQDVCAAQ